MPNGHGAYDEDYSPIIRELKVNVVDVYKTLDQLSKGLNVLLKNLDKLPNQLIVKG